jgi:hypothetical protein
MAKDRHGLDEEGLIARTLLPGTDRTFLGAALQTLRQASKAQPIVKTNMGM